jgi:hypothetical protein
MKYSHSLDCKLNHFKYNERNEYVFFFEVQCQ